MTAPKRQPRCAHCEGVMPPDIETALRPFCSKRCKMADLAKWFRGEHAIPGEPADLDVENGEDK
jgi:uncharacterized protein